MKKEPRRVACCIINKDDPGRLRFNYLSINILVLTECLCSSFVV